MKTGSLATKTPPDLKKSEIRKIRSQKIQNPKNPIFRSFVEKNAP